MTALSLGLWLAKATALLLIAIGLTIGLRRAPAGARYLVWLATLVALLFTPALSAWSPLSLPLLPSEASSTVMFAAPDASAPLTHLERTPSGSSHLGAIQPSASPVQTGGRSLSWWRIALIVWGVVTGVLLCWLALGA